MGVGVKGFKKNNKPYKIRFDPILKNKNHKMLAKYAKLKI